MNKGFLLLFFCSAGLISCNKPVDNSSLEATTLLFKESTQLIKETCNKFKEAKDSTELDSLSDLFEKRFTDLNMKFPSNTDLNMTEQDNDSIFKLITLLRNIKENKLKEFSLNVDTLSTDSISLKTF